MADPVVPEEIPFDSALAELVAELAKTNPVAAKRVLEKATVGAGAYGLPSMPDIPRNALSGETVGDRSAAAMGLPTGAAPYVDTMLEYEPILREFTGVPQINRAGDAIVGAINDPSLASVTNAGVQGAMAVAKPMAALKILGGGYAGAAAMDAADMFTGDADAQSLTRDQKRQQKIDDARAKRDADIAERAAAAQAARDRVAADEKAARDLRTAAEASKQDEYNRAVKHAEALAAKEMGRDRRFSDTAVGKLYDATGGLAPALAGLLGAKMSRLATGPGQTWYGIAGKDYALPLASGTLTGAITANLPLAYNALGTEPDNPKRRMYEALAENMPAGHAKQVDAVSRLQDKVTLPEANPVRTAASAEFYDPEKMKERLIMGGAEGFGGGLFGTDIVRAIGRALKGRSGTGPPTAAPSGGGGGGTPGANALSTPSTSGAASSGHILPETVVAPNALAAQPRLADRLPQYRAQVPQPASEAVPNQPASSSPKSRVIVQSTDSRGVTTYRHPKGTRGGKGGKFTSGPSDVE